jgi:hypothetical protein
MVMLKTFDDQEEGSMDGRYARTEEELYEKAIALLEKCRIEAQSTGQEVPESTVETSPKAV